MSTKVFILFSILLHIHTSSQDSLPWVCRSKNLFNTMVAYDSLPPGAWNTPLPIAAGQDCTFTIYIDPGSYLFTNLTTQLFEGDAVHVWNNYGTDIWFNGTTYGWQFYENLYFPLPLTQIRIITGYSNNTSILVNLQWNKLYVDNQKVQIGSQLYLLDLANLQNSSYTFMTNTTNEKIAVLGVRNDSNSDSLLRSTFVFDGSSVEADTLPSLNSAVSGASIVSTGNTITLYCATPWKSSQTGVYLAVIAAENIASFSSYSVIMANIGQTLFSYPITNSPNDRKAMTLIYSNGVTYLDSVNATQNGTLDVYEGSPTVPSGLNIVSYRLDKSLPNKLPQQFTGYMKTFVVSGRVTLNFYTDYTYEKWTTARDGRSGFVASLGNSQNTQAVTISSNSSNFEFSYQISTLLPIVAWNTVEVTVTKDGKTINSTIYDSPSINSTTAVGNSLSIKFDNNSTTNTTIGEMVYFSMKKINTSFAVRENFLLLYLVSLVVITLIQ